MRPIRVLSLTTLVAAAALAAGLALTLAPPRPARAFGLEPSPTLRLIEVDARATLELEADRVSLSLTVTEKSGKPREAFAGVWRKRDRLLAALKRAGVADGDVTVAHATLGERYRDGKPDGFEAAIAAQALVRQPAQLAAVIEAAVDAGATGFHTQFESSKLTESKKRVRDLALAAAREKAQQIAGATGVTLGAVQGVVEARGSASAWPFGGAAEGNVVNTTAAEHGEAGRPGTIPLGLTMRVSYAIR
jgi:hypothetical protein